jgi:hypothetical protein
LVLSALSSCYSAVPVSIPLLCANGINFKTSPRNLHGCVQIATATDLLGLESVQ